MCNPYAFLHAGSLNKNLCLAGIITFICIDFKNEVTCNEASCQSRPPKPVHGWHHDIAVKIACEVNNDILTLAGNRKIVPVCQQDTLAMLADCHFFLKLTASEDNLSQPVVWFIVPRRRKFKNIRDKPLCRRSRCYPRGRICRNFYGNIHIALYLYLKISTLARQAHIVRCHGQCIVLFPSHIYIFHKLTVPVLNHNSGTSWVIVLIGGNSK